MSLSGTEWQGAFLRSLPTKGTRDSYASLLSSMNGFFKPFRGDEGQDDLVRYIRSIESHGLSPTTVRKRLHQLRRLIAWCCQRRLRENNVVELSWVRRVRDQRRPKCLRRDELTRVAGAFDVKSWRGRRDAAIFALMAIEGLRIGEVSKIDVGDVEFL